MDVRTETLRPEDLLRHAQWVRRVAAHLVVDAARADDLAQQTLLTALAQPPDDGAHPRAWLGSVARSLARRMRRSEERRARHESAAASPATGPSVHKVVVQAQTQRDVVDAVLALAEPCRTVLLLRFFENRPPRAIARELGLPVETVKTRLKRALELLRAEYVARRGDVKGAAGEWAVALVGLLDDGLRRAVRRAVLAEATGAASAGAGVAGATALTGALGVLAMSTPLKLAAALLVVAAGTLAVVKIAGTPTSPRDEVAGAARAAAERADPTAAPAAELPSPAAATRAPESREPVAEKTAAAPAPVTVASVEGIVLTPDGEPAAGATVLLENAARQSEFGTVEGLCSHLDELLEDLPTRPHEPRHRIVTGEDGTFRFADLAPGVAVNLAAIAPKEGTALEAGVAVPRDGKPTEVELHLVEGVVLHGSVTDEEGRPIARARVMLEQVKRVGGKTNSTSLSRLLTDENGRYRTISLPFRSFLVSAAADGFFRDKFQTIDLPEGEHDHVADVRLTRAVTLRGRILAPDGNPAGLAQRRGELWLAWSIGDPRKNEESIGMLAAQIGKLDRAADRYEVTPNLKGPRFISLWDGDQVLGAGSIVTPGIGPDVVVDLSKVAAAAPTGTLSIEVVDAGDGSPVPKFKADFWLDPTGANDARFEFEMHGGQGTDGRLEIPDLRPGPYDVSIRAAGFAPRHVVATVSAPPTVTRVELEKGTGFVTGRLLDEDGHPVAGADVYLLGPDGRVAAPWPECRSTSDRDGAFAFKKVAEGDYTVVAESDQFAPAAASATARAMDASAGADVVLTLRSGVTIEFTPRSGGVDLRGPFVFRIRDERGVPVVDHRRRPGLLKSTFGKGASLFRLAPGPYTVELFSPNFAPAKVPFTASEGKVIEVELTPAH
jgi:RNA polymerase sigma factor (sigma-70 family)